MRDSYRELVESTYVEPGHDVGPPPNQGSGGRHPLRYSDKEEKFPDGTAIRRLDVRVQEQIASLTDAVDRLQKRIEMLERREPW